MLLVFLPITAGTLKPRNDLKILKSFQSTHKNACLDNLSFGLTLEIENKEI